ncbi:aryl hydrocarbon receptor nuclear translocator-like protein 1, partial [Cynoglossus semilaevis]|uniref:aryl hydrocarbon receptor nuclear translocator-like protein 1 n=1 Tax=Cynoglossus semilaevis TaxID=244447 RepID=UPI000D62BBB7
GPQAYSLLVAELPRKRKGDVEETSTHLSSDLQLDDDLSRSEGDDQPVKVKCFRKPYRQIEKLRRDKLNQLIDELSTMIPACQPVGQRLDKLTVLRKAVQHLRALRAASGSSFTVVSSIPSILSPDDLHDLLHSVSDRFLLVVSCDRAKILFISESVFQLLHYSRVELTGQSLLDFIHHRDINKVKEQLSSADLPAPPPPSEAAAGGAAVQTDSSFMASLLSTGGRRSFFCRMKRVHRSRKCGVDQSLPSTSKQNDSYSYCTLHCTGYMRLWPSGQTDSEDGSEGEASRLPCLVTACRLHPQVSHRPSSKDVQVKPPEFVTRCAIDGKFTFVDQQATTVLGYLPQELLGTSCYEYFHQDDLQHLAERHRQVLQSKEKLETRRYRFKTKHGSYVTLQSHWFGFTNPWTKEVEFIVSVNRVVCRGPAELKDDGGSTQEDSDQIPIIPGLSTDSGTLFYVGSIGTQIANELMDSYRTGSSPSSGASSPFCTVQEKCPVVPLPTSRSAFTRGGATGSMAESESESRTESGPGRTESENTVLVSVPGESSQSPDTGPMVLPGLRDVTSNDAAMAVIMSLLETDVNMGQSADLDLDWPF